MNTYRSLLVALACALPLLASAQWQWLDKDGRKVFSDQPPPASVPEKSILRRPGARPATPAADGAAAPGTAPAPALAAPQLSGKDKELEQKKKQQEAAAAEKRKAEEEQVNKQRAENCERAKAAKATFDSGVRIRRTNQQGEREVLDDSARAVESKRLEGVISTECAPRQPTLTPKVGTPAS